MKQVYGICLAAAFMAGTVAAASADENNVWDTLSANCGKAFVGKIVKDTDPSDTWTNAEIIMHVRDCSETQIKVPLHVDTDRSRIWVLTKLPSGKMRLKHDHRHADGSADDVTMYGGTSEGAGAAAATITFPVDGESIAMFKKNGLDASVSNSWHLSVGEATFHYKLTRPTGREFDVAFDLTAPVLLPPKAWDIGGKPGH